MGSSVPMIRPGAWAAGWLAAAIGAAPLHAEYQYPDVNQIQETDIQQFMESMAWQLRSCNTELIADRFTPGGVVWLVHANGEQERLTPSDYGKMGRYCQPYRIIKWDGSHNEVGFRQGSGAAGNTATVRWRLEWGGQEPGRNGKPVIQFENWMELIKTDGRIRIAVAGERTRELVPGAEETFYLKTEGGDVMYPLIRVSTTIGRIVGEIGDRFRSMILRQHVTQEHDVPHDAN